MVGHQVSAASRPQSSLFADSTGLPRSTSPGPNTTIDDLTGKSVMSQTLGNNSTWGGIWRPTAGPIGTGFGSTTNRQIVPQQQNSKSGLLGVQKSNGFPSSLEADNSSFSGSGAIPGTTSILPGEADTWSSAKTGLGWSNDASPSLQNVVATEGVSSPPTRMRTSQEQSPKNSLPGRTSPFFMPRHNPSQSVSSTNGIFDATSFGDLRGREVLGNGAAANAENRQPRFLGSTNGQHSRVVSNPRVIGAPTDLNSRSESLPPQRTNSTPPDGNQQTSTYGYGFGQNGQQSTIPYDASTGIEDLGNRMKENLRIGSGFNAAPSMNGLLSNGGYYQPGNTLGQEQYLQQSQYGGFPTFQSNRGFTPSLSQTQMGWPEMFDQTKANGEYPLGDGGLDFNRMGGTVSPRADVTNFSDSGGYPQYFANGTPPSAMGRALPRPGMNTVYGRPPSFPGEYSMYGVPLPPRYPVAPLSPLAIGQPHAVRAKQDDFPHNLRSTLLEEFRSNSKSNKKYELKDIYNHVVEFSGDQHGSRFIQMKLETANSDEKDIIFREIRPNSLQLMTDVFGNYVIQKFFEHGSQLQKTTLAKQMEGHVLTLSRQMYGCRVVQKALEHILTDQQATLVKELDGHVLACVKDQNGNHVIQKAIERVPAEHIQFIIDAFHGQVHSLATHPYGCRVIQRMLEYCNEEAQSSILSELHVCTYALVQDQYGNYVTQHVIQHGKPEDKAKIVSVVAKHLLQFSKHKFASNVVEKSIEYGTDDQRRTIMEVICNKVDGQSPLQLLMRDQFGNYVIQKLLQLLPAKDREYLVEQIKPQLPALKRFSYGKQIAAIEKLIYHSGTGQTTPSGHSPKSSIDSSLSVKSNNPPVDAPKAPAAAKDNGFTSNQ